MFPFARRVKDKAFTALIPAEHGLSVATVKNDSGAKPFLINCDYVPCTSRNCDAEFIKKHSKSFRMANRACTTTMNMGEYTILSVEAPDVPPAELRAAVRWQIKDLIDFHIDDAVLDVFDAPASGADKRQHNLYVVVSRMNTVKQHINHLQAAELNLTTIDIPELVIRNICAYCPEDKSGMVFIYLAKDQGVFTITRDATLYLARSLEFGYEKLINSTEQAGELSDDDFNPEFDRVVLEIQRSLDYYDRYFSQPNVAKIVISPTEELIPGLVDYLKRNTGITTAILDVNEIVDSAEPLDPLQQARCLLAIGAALRQEKKTL
ncbi:pilus assembly protein PilM [Kaarinaea lacus]